MSKKRFGIGLRKTVREGLDSATRRQLFDQNHCSVVESPPPPPPPSNTKDSSGSGGGEADDDHDDPDLASGGGGSSSSSSSRSGTADGAATFKKTLNLLEKLGVENAVEFDMEPHMAYYCNNHTVWHGRSDVVRGYQRLLVRQHLAFLDAPNESGHSDAAMDAAAEEGHPGDACGDARPLSAHKRLREALVS